MRPISKPLLLVVTLLAATVGGQHTAAADPIGRLLDLMSKRLSIVSEVARYKWSHGMPVADVAQERAVLDAVAAEAGSRGISEDIAENFFGSQVTAAKTLQQSLFDEWKAAGQGPFAGVADLDDTLRPRLAALMPTLLTALRDALPELQDKAVTERLAEVPKAWRRYPEAWDAAVAPLLSFAAGEY
jgi:chorismate mutase